MPDLSDRHDVDVLLRSFYRRVFADPVLAPIFVDVAHMDLEAHLPVIGDFWQKVLFNTGQYGGQAMRVHRRLHRRVPLQPEHFARWLALWALSVDAGFQGPVAEQAKAQAARIAVAIQHNLTADRGRPPSPRTALPLVPTQPG